MRSRPSTRAALFVRIAIPAALTAFAVFGCGLVFPFPEGAVVAFASGVLGCWYTSHAVERIEREEQAAHRPFYQTHQTREIRNYWRGEGWYFWSGPRTLHGPYSTLRHARRAQEDRL